MAEPLPPWAETYAARLLHRFPDVFLALGDPEMAGAFQLPPKIEVVGSETERIVRINLQRRLALVRLDSALAKDDLLGALSAPVLQHDCVGEAPCGMLPSLDWCYDSPRVMASPKEEGMVLGLDNLDFGTLSDYCGTFAAATTAAAEAAAAAVAAAAVFDFVPDCTVPPPPSPPNSQTYPMARCPLGTPLGVEGRSAACLPDPEQACLDQLLQNCDLTGCGSHCHTDVDMAEVPQQAGSTQPPAAIARIVVEPPRGGATTPSGLASPAFRCLSMVDCDNSPSGSLVSWMRDPCTASRSPTASPPSRGRQLACPTVVVRTPSGGTVDPQASDWRRLHGHRQTVPQATTADRATLRSTDVNLLAVAATSPRGTSSMDCGRMMRPHSSGAKADDSPAAGHEIWRSLTMPNISRTVPRYKGDNKGLAQRRGLVRPLSLNVIAVARESSADSMRSKGAASRASSGEAVRMRPDRCKYGSNGLERANPAVLLLRNSGANRRPLRNTVAVLQRPLPASFPFRKTIFFIDWDDTLCPTSWIRTVLKNRIAGLQEWMEGSSTKHTGDDWLHHIPAWFSLPLPDDPQVQASIDELQQEIIKLVTLAQTYGVVCIVTNAVPGWVNKTVRKWLPQLIPHILGHGALPRINVIYGQMLYRRPTGASASLPFVDDEGEHMWWKQAAMKNALENVDELYRLTGIHCLSPMRTPTSTQAAEHSFSWCACGQAAHVTNVISIGDSEAEMQSTELATRSFVATTGFAAPAAAAEAAAAAAAQPSLVPLPAPEGRRSLSAEPFRRPPAVKLVKLMEVPHIQQLRAQLAEVAEMLPRVVTTQANFRINVEDPLSSKEAGKPTPRPLLLSDAEVRAQLPAQTV